MRLELRLGGDVWVSHLRVEHVLAGALQGGAEDVGDLAAGLCDVGVAGVTRRGQVHHADALQAHTWWGEG